MRGGGKGRGRSKGSAGGAPTGQERREERRAQRQGGPPEDRKGGGAGEAALEWVKSIALILVLYFFIKSFLIQTFVITSGSMEDTLLVGDFLMVNRASIGSPIPGTSLRIPGYSQVRQGDVLVFDPTHEDDLMLVKRLIGMPGDTLEMRDKALYRNGQLQDEPYVKHLDDQGDDHHPWMEWQRPHVIPESARSDYRPTRDNWGPLVIPEGYYFMLGDNRDYSLDSRYWGLLERWRLEGRALFHYFSYDRDSPAAFSFLREVRWDRIGRRIR
ncbi:MAG: signal peptidase I [Gemmatimonadota bacterium]